MSERTKQAPSTGEPNWDWVDRTIWTDRMLAALGNGVRGRELSSADMGLFTMYEAWHLASQSRS